MDRLVDALEAYCAWLFSQPIKRTLTGRNDRGRNVVYLRGKIGGRIPRRRQVLTVFKKGWYVHEQQMD